MAQERSKCADCGTVLKPRAQVCPACGSSRLDVETLLDFNLELPPDFPLKVTVRNADGPSKKVPKQIVTKREVHRDSGRIQQTTRTFDRFGDQYQERIVDAHSGEVLVKTDEPLSEHHGHGSAKDKKKEGGSDAHGQ